MQRLTVIVRATAGFVVALALLLHSLPFRPATAKAQTESAATPFAAEADAGSLAAMLGRLPDLPLGQDGAMVTYANIALQTASLRVTPPRGIDDEEVHQRWIAAIGTLMLPQSTAQHWLSPEWQESFGFDLFQVEQAVEYAAPPLGITVLRGSFDPAELRAAWTRAGYQPIDLGAGEAYAVRADYEIDFQDPGSRMALAYLNVVALADDGTLIFGSARDGVRGALAAAAGQEPSFAARADIAPLVRAAPPELVSALLVNGALLQATTDPAEIVLGEESPEAFATRAAAEQVEARRLPPIVAALIGQTAGTFEADSGETTATETLATTADSVRARLAIVLTTLSPAMAEEVASVLADRLATQRTPASLGDSLADRPWSDVFPEHSVQAVPGEPAVLIELTPAPETPPLLIQNMLFRRSPGFLAWAP